MKDFNLVKSNVAKMVAMGAPEKDIDQYLGSAGYTAMDLRHGGKVDAESGASWKARALVGLYDKPEQRMAVLKQFYADVKPEGKDNFVVTDPKTGKKVLFNPDGLDWGDVAGAGRDISTIVGGTLGAVAGTAGATPGLGTVAGAAGGAALGGMAADKLGDMITGQQRGPLETLTRPAIDMAVNAAGQGVGNGIARLIGPQVGRLSGMAGDQLTSLAERLGIPLPTRGTAFQNRGLQTLEQGVANTFGGAQVMEGASQKTLNALREAIDKNASALGAVYPNAEELGSRALQSASASTNRLRDEAAQRFGAVYSGIENQPVAGLSQTQRYIQGIADSISDPMEKARFLADPTVDRALNLATSPNLDVQTLKSALTDMSQRAYRPASAIDTATASDAQLRGLLSSLGADRDAAVTALGRGQQLADANTWYANEKGLRSALEGVFGSKYQPVDLNLLMSGAPGQGVALDAASVGKKLLDPALPANTQRAIQAALGADYGDIAATRIARMADSTPGAQGVAGDLASPSTLLTNWNKSAKTGGEAVVPQNIDGLLKVAAALKDAEKMANTSGTARSLSTSGLLAGLGYGASDMYGGDRGQNLSGAAAGAVLPALLALALANPRAITSPGAMRAFGLSPGLVARILAQPASGITR